MGRQKFFDSTVKLFEDYRNKMKKGKTDNYNSDLANEVWMRLRQLSFICEKIRSYEQNVRSTSIINEARKLMRFMEEGMVFVEAFYFFAWRIICITEHYTKPLPYLQGLKKKAKGITIVRNCLIEHPEKQKEKVFLPSYMWGNDGPVLKNARPAGQTFDIQDRGLWINAQEFKDGLEELLQNVIKQ
jgi:hypothetical protein